MLNLAEIRTFFKTQPVVKAWLFGSYARGEENASSDVDILVEFDRNAKVGLLQHAKIICLLEELLHKRVDLVPENGVYPYIKEHINKEKILIYERI